MHRVCTTPIEIVRVNQDVESSIKIVIWKSLHMSQKYGPPEELLPHVIPHEEWSPQKTVYIK